MIANYGYEDGTGFYYLAIDTDECVACEVKDCVRACREEVFEVREDDWGDEVVVVSETKIHLLKDCCAACKQGAQSHPDLPCLKACASDAIQFTW